MTKKIEIYDTTLRDGAQSLGVNFSVSDKLKIIKLLDELGVDYIEAGWPGANPKDVEVFDKVKSLNLLHAKVTAFGSTKKPFVKPEEDQVLSMLAASSADIVTIFGKTWDFHVTEALNTTLEENLNMISESVSYLKSCGKEVFFDAEHFFDGYKRNPDYAIAALNSAKTAGATRLILCDTNGGFVNNEIYNITKQVISAISDIEIGIHAHNDGDLAVANSIAAIDAGAIQLQGTINGCGERCGNANLCSIIPNLVLKKEYKTSVKLEKLTFIAASVAEISNISLPSNAPFVGAGAFAHKAGVHASGVRKNPGTYEHIDPETVGNERKILVSDQAGTASIKEKIAHLRLVKDVSDSEIPKIIEKIKGFEWKGFAYEGAEASFELLIMQTLGKMPEYFDIVSYRMIGDAMMKPSELNTEASVKLKVQDEIIHSVSEGDGPVNALDSALRKALVTQYPEINNFRLNDFKVRILDSSSGSAATVRVTIETTDGFNTWDTVGVNPNIIKASYMAIVDSLLYGLILHNAKPKA